MWELVTPGGTELVAGTYHRSPDHVANERAPLVDATHEGDSWTIVMGGHGWDYDGRDAL